MRAGQQNTVNKKGILEGFAAKSRYYPTYRRSDELFLKATEMLDR